MLKAAIVGGSGYTGLELLRILNRHPKVEVIAVTSRKNKGKRLQDLFPSLYGTLIPSYSAPRQMLFLPRFPIRPLWPWFLPFLRPAEKS